MAVQIHLKGSLYVKFSTIRRGQCNSIKRILNWIVKGVLLAGLLVFTVLLAWAFESRSMPALRAWHMASLSAEFTAREAMPERTLQDYLDREERLFPSFPNRMHCCGDHPPCKEYPDKTQQDRYDPSEGRGRYDIAVTDG